MSDIFKVYEYRKYGFDLYIVAADTPDEAVEKVVNEGGVRHNLLAEKIDVSKPVLVVES